MSIPEIITTFLANALPSLNPNALVDQLMERFLRILRALIVIAVLVITTCISLGFLIDRFLTQLDTGTVALTPSMILLLVVFFVSAVGIGLVLSSISRRASELKKAQNQTRVETALETALAALIMSYVDERKQKEAPEGASSVSQI